jgi:hypothetical protein
MRRLRTASPRHLAIIVGLVIAVVAGAGIAQAALNSSPTPAPKPLDQALMAAANAPKVQGITARIHFVNNLLPSGSLPQDTASPVLTGADGRLWLAQDGRLRLELQSDAGDAQIVVGKDRYSIYDAASKTAYVGDLPPEQAPSKPEQPATLAGIDQALSRLGQMWNLSGATPTNTAGRPSYTLRISPKDDGGLLGAAEVAWDAANGVPLRAAIYAQGADKPVLELEATSISYGSIPDSDLNVAPPAGTKTVQINPPTGHDAQGRPTHVEGLDNVRKAVDFQLSAPDKLAGLPRKHVSLVDFGGEKGALVTYGQGMGAILVFQHKGAQQLPQGRDGLRLPTVNIDGATGSELATSLGTVLLFQRGDVSYTVIGSVPPTSAENAARDLG